MKRCPQCGREYPDEANFCPNDSTPLESKRHVEGDPLVGSVFHRRYEVQERLGAGGFGTVYKVRDTGTGRTVALKVVHPHILQYRKQIDRFKQEARLMANLRADQIPTLYDFNRDEQRKLWYFTLDYISGITLQRILEEEGAIPPRRTLALTRQVCAALQVAHGQDPPVIHRDLKPDNLMIVREDGREEIKILDFGIAKIRGHDSLTDAGQFPGSYGYMSPEQLDGDVDPRTDLFAVGVILYNLLTGKDPWLGRPVGTPLQRGSQMKILRLTSDGEFIPPEVSNPRIPGELAAMITRLLQKEPADRFQSAAALDAALARAQERLEESDTPVEPTPRPSLAERLSGGARALSSGLGDAVARPVRAIGAGLRGGVRGVASGAGRTAEGVAGATRSAGRGLARLARGLGEASNRAYRGGVRAIGSTFGAVGSGLASVVGAVGSGAGRLLGGIRRGVAAIPRPSARILAIIAGAGALVAGLVLVVPRLPGGSPETPRLTPDQLRARIAAGDVRELRVREGGALEASIVVAGGGVVDHRIGEGGGESLQGLLGSARDAEVPIAGEGAGTVSVGPTAPNAPPAPLDSLCLRPLGRPDAECRSLGSGATPDLPAGWYSVRDRAAGWRMESAALALGTGAGEELPGAAGDSAVFFLPGGTRARLLLSGTAPGHAAADSGAATDSTGESADPTAQADALAGRARAALEEGRVTAALGLVERALAARPAHPPAEALRSRIAATFRGQARRALEREDYGAGRQAADRCLRAAPGDGECEAMRTTALESLARPAEPGSAGRPSFGASGPDGVPVRWQAGERAERYRVRWEGQTREVAETSAVLPLTAATEVCVTTLNAAGAAPETCSRYEPPASPAVLSLGGSWRFGDVDDRGCAIITTTLALQPDGTVPERAVRLTCQGGTERPEIPFRIVSASVTSDRVTLQVLRDGERCTYTASYSRPSAERLRGSFRCPSIDRSGQWRLTRQP